MKREKGKKEKKVSIAWPRLIIHIALFFSRLQSMYRAVLSGWLGWDLALAGAMVIRFEDQKGQSVGDWGVDRGGFGRWVL